MTKFVTFKTLDGPEVLVNPDRVAYVKVKSGRTCIVFGAMPGGYDEIFPVGGRDEVVRQLEGRKPPAPAKAPAEPKAT